MKGTYQYACADSNDVMLKFIDITKKVISVLCQTDRIVTDFDIFDYY